jgi:uncharacterized protein YjiS (DUF1127 family)
MSGASAMLVNRKSVLHADSVFATAAPATSAGNWLRQEFLIQLMIQLLALRHTIGEWQRRHRSRQELRALSAYEVRDFCLDPNEAERETRKPFWRE